MSELDVECCDPREREAEIKQLFARNGQREFEAVFERAYRPRAADGLRSWIGRRCEDTVAHISVTPVRFGDGRKSLVGGVLGDLMVERSLRDFWTPVRMVRAVVRDVRRTGNVDFLITTSTAEAESVFKAGGFKPFARMRRYVMPLSYPYLLYASWRAGTSRRIQATPVTTNHADLAAVLPSRRSADRWRPHASVDFYATRMERRRFAEGTWVSIPCAAGDDGLALISTPGTMRESEIADAFWCSDSRAIADVLLAAAWWSRAQGYRKLTLSTLDESRVAEQLRSAGFLARSFRSNLLLLKIRESPPPVTDWFLTGFPLSGW